MADAIINYEGVEEFDLADYCEKSYLEYALYVIKDRVLPFVGDGLKPVQRRIIYTMAIEGINTSAKKKKSAYTVGQVLGRFHPHGDSACYEAMVNMAQNFNFRYPLISGQGNFGDLFNPKGFAAMRYTESFLSHYSVSLLSELNSGNVEFTSNYNGDEKEPNYLPSRLPNILLNGTMGIAVGMTTAIPPHNINEVIDACCALINDPHLSVRDIMKYIKGPDYPSKAEITNSFEELVNIYTTGSGLIRLRAVWKYYKDQIIITELPYQSAPNLIVKIAELIATKKITTIEDIRDDSSETETKIILQLKSSRVDTEALMQQLLCHTDLEKTQQVNLNMIGINGKPQVKNLVQILTEWLEFRKNIVRKRYLYRLEKLGVELNRIHGLLIAHDNIEEVIKIVRNDPNPKHSLMEQFNLNEEQATTILDLKIRNLAKLEQDQLIKQEKALLTEQKVINRLLASKTKFNEQIKKELLATKEEFKQERNSPIVFREKATKNILTQETPKDPITVVISKMGWIRCGKGHNLNLDNLTYRTGDEFFLACEGYLNQPLYLIDSTGRTFTISPTILPAFRGYGDSITAFINLVDNASIVTMVMGDPEQKIIIASSSGNGFICKLDDLKCRQKAGKNFITLSQNENVIQPLLLPSNVELNEKVHGINQLTLITNQGRVLSCELSSLAERPKGGKGYRLIKIDNKKILSGEDYLRQMLLTSNKSSLVIKNGSRSSNIDNNTFNKCKSERGNTGKPVIKGISNKTIISVKTI